MNMEQSVVGRASLQQLENFHALPDVVGEAELLCIWVSFITSEAMNHDLRRDLMAFVM